jgi:hypothetical protein
VAVSDPDGRRYSGSDVKRIAGLSSRQQSDWDGRGALPHERQGEEGWRRYTPREVFVLAVCAELKRRFGTPIERLRNLQTMMLEDGGDYFAAAVRSIVGLRAGVWLVTDFEGFLLMDTEAEMGDLWHQRAFSGGKLKSLAFLRVNHIVHAMLSQLDPPVEVQDDGYGFDLDLRDEIRRQQSVWTPEEQHVLQRLRDGTYVKVQVELEGGRIETVRSTSSEEVPEGDIDQLKRLFSHPYQSVKVISHAGNVVRILKEVVTKPRRGSE